MPLKQSTMLVPMHVTTCSDLLVTALMLQKLSPTTTSIEHIPEGSIYKNRYVDVLPGQQ